MNNLFNAISWTRYVEMLVIGTLIYYAIVGLRYYRPEMTNLFRRGSFNRSAPDQTNPFLALEQEPETDTPKTENIYQHLEGFDSNNIEAETLIAALRARIDDFSEQPYQPAAVPSALKVLIRKYPGLKNAVHRAVINELIVAECEKTGIAQLTEDEVDQWWSD